MSSVPNPEPAWTIDVGEYCRAVEAYLTRINEGQIVRIVGPAFEMVRTWALDGVPLSVVFYGIGQKAERHKSGRSTRPLRLEFCEHDVRAAYDHWRRAVGVSRLGDSGQSPVAEDDAKRRPSLVKHLERSIDRLVRASGRADLPDAFRDRADAIVGALSAIQGRAKGAKGDAREEMLRELAALDERLASAIRAAADAPVVVRARQDAAAELAPYRGRLEPDAWQRSVDLGVDRLLREQFGLPTLSFES